MTATRAEPRSVLTDGQTAPEASLSSSHSLARQPLHRCRWLILVRVNHHQRCQSALDTAVEGERQAPKNQELAQQVGGEGGKGWRREGERGGRRREERGGVGERREEEGRRKEERGEERKEGGERSGAAPVEQERVGWVSLPLEVSRGLCGPSCRSHSARQSVIAL